MRRGGSNFRFSNVFFYLLLFSVCCSFSGWCVWSCEVRPPVIYMVTVIGRINIFFFRAINLYVKQKCNYLFVSLSLSLSNDDGAHGNGKIVIFGSRPRMINVCGGHRNNVHYILRFVWRIPIHSIVPHRIWVAAKCKTRANFVLFDAVYRLCERGMRIDNHKRARMCLCAVIKWNHVLFLLRVSSGQILLCIKWNHSEQLLIHDSQWK